MNSTKAARLRPHCPVKVTHGAYKGAVGSVVVVAMNVLEERTDGKPERRMGCLVSGVHIALVWVSNRNLEVKT